MSAGAGRPWATGLNLALLAVVAGRIAAALWAAIFNIKGDYYASLPGAYVRTVNPTLWDSPDMQGAWGYHLDTYFHGPVQYLTLYPLAYLDSYAQMAAALLPLYAVALAVGFWLLRGALSLLAPKDSITVPLFASTFLFFPLLQAFIQREFEVVAFVALAAALGLVLRDRRGAAGVVLAYLTWFKYTPLIFTAYFALRRWYGAIAAYVLASVVILGVAHAVFGLGLFVNNNVPSHAAQVFNLWSFDFRPGANGYLYGYGFCHGWIEIETTLANVRHALCSLGAARPGLPVNLIYLALCAVIAGIYLLIHARFERRRATAAAERWRRALELSIVITVYTCFLFNHYYYLIVLIVPLNVLLVRHLSEGRTARLAVWAVAYFLIAAFIVPTSITTRLLGTDVWAFYIKGAWFLWGELLLMALLLREYSDVCESSSEEHGVGQHRVL
jgi:hypothetical protein